MEQRRASPAQFYTLLEFMERNGDLARPQPGAQGRARADRLWTELSNLLNSVGGGAQKNTEKWKKVWADWKSKTKKKALAIRHHASGTGGGPNSHINLTAHEERLLAIIGIAAVEGNPQIEEQGLNIIPSQPAPAPINVNVVIEDGVAQLSPPSPQVRSPPMPSPPSPPAPVGTLPPTPAPGAARSLATTGLPPAPPADSTPPSRSQQHRRSPRSSISTPRRTTLRPRRRRRQTPFDRAVSEFVAVEQRRIRVDEMRERNEQRRLELERERNDVFRRLAEIGQMCLEIFRQSLGQ